MLFLMSTVLEGEMYQLSHMLTDQKSIISTMLEMSLTSDQGIHSILYCAAAHHARHLHL
jgi:hypothetical protein